MYYSVILPNKIEIISIGKKIKNENQRKKSYIE